MNRSAAMTNMKAMKNLSILLNEPLYRKLLMFFSPFPVFIIFEIYHFIQVF
jgi:hypothetical protein